MTMLSDGVSRVRLFRNPWLERLTVLSFPGFVGLWSVAIPVIFWVAWGSAGVLQASAMVLGGLLFWSLTEYVLHRHVFHWKSDWPPLAALLFMIHGNHHAVPNDPLRNLMPPLVSIPVHLLFFLSFDALMGPTGIWFFAGFIIGYVSYDFVHYTTHQWPGRTRLGKLLKRNHMRHHFARTEGNYAITAMFWDRAFGTRIDRRNEEQREGRVAARIDQQESVS
ncbi:sterol desaturase family protein [Polymorphobacter multimanifer]|uniref:Sterol desaturase/sphingolipid hydroxylase (Fatty acid hydroxylase superfamily) n=1 Tax=Polymorphobacter multimanifer TaxID=1070431 RepID=A0A841L6R4_9SPHN|nr:sterol desaturase family protein [Polymorphobacter multimanifer]MBB6228297.1 sterol desaturase/sphingolipid hydroxylase (fatty acid hydroxylase superfamily) [Polymorphobacter multimanifer]